MSHERIETHPAVMQGKPVIRGTRLTVEQIVRDCGHTLSAHEVADQYPRLSETDVLAALAFAAKPLAEETL